MNRTLRRSAAAVLALTALVFAIGAYSAAFGSAGAQAVSGVPAAPAVSRAELREFQSFARKQPGRWQFLGGQGTGRIQDVFGAATASYGRDPQVAARRFVASNAALVNADLADLRVARVTTKKAASHIIFRQYYEGVPVEGAFVQVHLDKQGRVVWLETLADPDVSSAATRPRISASDAERRAAGSAGAERLPSRHPSTTLVIFPTESGDRLSYKVRFHTDKPLGSWVYFVDALDGTIVAARNEIVDGSGTVTAKILPVDPTTAVSQRGMANEYVTVAGQRTTTGASGAYSSTANGTVVANMTGPWARVVNEDQHGASRTGTTYSWTWNYVTSDSHFDEVNVFYHMNRAHDYFKQTFGISQMDYEMTATVHKDDNYPNAYYDPQERALFFGDGDGVSARDSAKAAEVIYHEYGHGTHDHVYAPMFEAGIYSMQIRSMGEAWADYFSQVLTNDDEFGEWWIIDPAQRRPLNNTKKYPTDMEGEEHADGPIYAGALWDYRKLVGGTIADRTVAASWYYRPTDFRSGLVAMLQADDELYGDMNLANGAPHETQIRQAFNAHGITTTLDEALGPVVFARNTNVGGLTMPCLYMAAADGTGARMIPSTRSWDWPDWNETARIIVGAGSDPLGNKVIYAIDPLTEMHAQVTGNLEPTGKVIAQYPSLSPAGDRVAFSWAYQGQAMYNLSIADVGNYDPLKPMGTDVANVDSMDAGANQYYPDWSKATNKIVYAQMYGPLIDKSKAGLWAVNPDGSGLTQITHPSYYFGGDGTLYSQGDLYPKWSRAGDKIAYVRMTTGVPIFGDYTYDYDIYVMRSDGADAPGTRVLQGRVNFPATLRVTAGYGLGDLSWSPSDDALMFGVATGADGLGFPTGYDLYKVNTNGTGLTRLTTDGGTATSSWGALDTSPPQISRVEIEVPVDTFDRLSFDVDAADAQSGLYNFQYAIGSSPGATDARLWTTISGATNRVTATGLALVNGRTYYVSVKAKNGHGYVSSTAVSSGIMASTDGRAPGPVTDFDAAPSSGRIDLGWVNPRDEDLAAVRILRSTVDYATSPTDTAGQTQVYEGTATACADTSLPNGTTYYYTAFARDAAGYWSAGARTGGIAGSPKIQTTFGPLVGVKPSPAYNSSASLSATLIASGAPLDGRDDVVVYKSLNGVDWSADGAAVSMGAGVYRASRLVTARTIYRFRFAGDLGYRIAVSNDVTLTSRAYLTTPSTPWAVRRSTYFTVSGYLKPRHSGSTRLYFYRYSRGWRLYRYVNARNVDYAGYTRYSVRYRVPYAGRWRVRAYHSDGDHLPTWGGIRYFTAR